MNYNNGKGWHCGQCDTKLKDDHRCPTCFAEALASQRDQAGIDAVNAADPFGRRSTHVHIGGENALGSDAHALATSCAPRETGPGWRQLVRQWHDDLIDLGVYA